MGRVLKDATTECHEKANQDCMRETMTLFIESKPVTVYKDEVEKMLYSCLNPMTLEYGA